MTYSPYDYTSHSLSLNSLYYSGNSLLCHGAYFIVSFTLIMQVSAQVWSILVADLWCIFCLFCGLA